MPKDRLLEFDVAKALCIILVVMGHNVPDISPSWWHMTHDMIYSFHMPLFIFASGYIYIATKKEESYLSLLKKKFMRLMVPYFVTSIMVISLKLLMHSNLQVDNPVTLLSYLRMFYLPEAGDFLWFIWALWWMFSLIYWFKTPMSRIFIFFLGAFMHYFPIPNLPVSFCIARSSRFLIWFMLGTVCYDWRKFFVHLKYIPTVVICLFFVGLEILHFTDIGGNLVNHILPYWGIGLIMSISKQIVSMCTTNILYIISASSYLIYLLHTTFMAPLRVVIMNLSIYNNENSIHFMLMVLIVCSVGIFVPVFIHRTILARFRITRLMFGLK